MQGPSLPLYTPSSQETTPARTTGFVFKEIGPIMQGGQLLEQLLAIAKVSADFLLSLHPNTHHTDITAAQEIESQQLQGVLPAFIYSAWKKSIPKISLPWFTLAPQSSVGIIAQCCDTCKCRDAPGTSTYTTFPEDFQIHCLLLAKLSSYLRTGLVDRFSLLIWREATNTTSNRRREMKSCADIQKMENVHFINVVIAITCNI